MTEYLTKAATKSNTSVTRAVLKKNKKKKTKKKQKKKKTYVFPQLSLTYRKFTHTNCLSSLQVIYKGDKGGANDFLGKLFQNHTFFFTRNLIYTPNFSL